MQLVTQEIRAQLIANGTGFNQDPDFDPLPVVKFFTPDAAATWLIASADPDEPDILFGLCRARHKPKYVERSAMLNAPRNVVDWLAVRKTALTIMSMLLSVQDERSIANARPNICRRSALAC